MNGPLEETVAAPVFPTGGMVPRGSHVPTQSAKTDATQHATVQDRLEWFLNIPFYHHPYSGMVLPQWAANSLDQLVLEVLWNLHDRDFYGDLHKNN